MRRSGLGLLLVACGLAACGGSTRTKTVTVTKTGVVAADGTYRMRFRNSDYTGENIVVSEGGPDPADRKFATTCQGATLARGVASWRGSRL